MEFQALIQAEQEPLTRRLSWLLGGDLDAAEDLHQEAVIRAWRRLPRQADGRSQRVWLHRTATNLAMDELRRRARRPSAPLIDAEQLPQADMADPEPVAEALA